MEHDIEPGVNLDMELEDGDSDDPLVPVSEMITSMARFIGQVDDPDVGQAYTIEQMTFDLPIELRVEMDDSGAIRLKVAPPTQQIETSVMPIFHQINLSVVKENE
jgi:hypothetical protein